MSITRLYLVQRVVSCTHARACVARSQQVRRQATEIRNLGVKVVTQSQEYTNFFICLMAVRGADAHLPRTPLPRAC